MSLSALNTSSPENRGKGGYRYRPCRVEASSSPERNLESAGALGSWRGVRCLGVALNEFREDSGKLAAEVALFFVDFAYFFGFIASLHTAHRSGTASRSRWVARHTLEQAPDGARQMLGFFHVMQSAINIAIHNFRVLRTVIQ